MKIDGELKDRGRIKWTAMMLPEHIALLRDWQAQDGLTERPELSEWDLAAIQEEIESAYKRKCETVIKTWRNGKIIEHQGTIDRINIHKKVIVLADPFGDEHIQMADMVSAQCIN